MNTTNTVRFRIATRPRLLLGARILDLVDAWPVQALAVMVAAVAGVAAWLVLA